MGRVLGLLGGSWAGLGLVGVRGRQAGLKVWLGWSPETEIGLFENGNIVSRPKI